MREPRWKRDFKKQMIREGIENRKKPFWQRIVDDVKFMDDILLRRIKGV